MSAEQHRQQAREEDKKVRELRFVADFACRLLYQERLSLDEALSLVAGVRQYALKLFPDKAETFDLVYGSRFRRILAERFPIC
jgi:hypothetical protein